MLVRLKKAFQKLDSAAFIFWLLDVNITKDCNDNQGGYDDDWGGVWRFKSTVPFFRQWASTAFRFLRASLLLIALALKTKAEASRLPIPIQLGQLASQASFVPFSRIYTSYILSSSSVTKTSESLFSNLLRLSLSLHLFILLTVIIYSSSGITVQF